MASQPQAFVYDALRTPRGRGKKTGSLYEVKPVDAGGRASSTRCAPRNPGLDPARVDDMVLGVVSPLGDQGGDIAKTAALAAGSPTPWRACRSTGSAPPAWRRSTRPPQKVRSGWDDLILAGGVESMSRVPMGSDGGAWAMDPETELRDPVRAAGHLRRPDRHARGLHPRRRRRATPRGRRQRAGQGVGRRRVRPLGGAGARPHRSGDPRPGRDDPAGDLVGDPRRAAAVVRRDRRAWAASTRWRCRATTGWSGSTTCTPRATPRASWTAPR